MKAYRTLSLLVIALGAGGLTAAQGCGSSDAGGGSSTAGPGRTPPPPPAGAAPSDTPARTFALNQLFLGETGRNGAVVKDAWKDYGYNIDGLISTKDSKDVCQRQGGADSAKQEDGKDGVDNAFGRTILSFIQQFTPTPTKTVNETVQKGDFTVLLDIRGLTDDPKQTNTGLGGHLLIGGPFGEGKKPTFSPADDWPYREEPNVPIQGAYITNGTFVNGSGGATVVLAISASGVQLNLTINRALITFEHQPPNDITNGTISGVINTEALVTSIQDVAGRLNASLCDGPTLDTVKQTIRQASDIRDDGTNSAGVPCNAISVGIGFTGKRIGPPKTVSKPSTSTTDYCKNPPPDGGTGDGG